MNLAIIVPTYNGGAIWHKCAENISKYKINGVPVYVVDSESTDETVNIAKDNNFNVRIIDKTKFNHGETRNEAVLDLPEEIDIAILLTQDAIPQENFCQEIIEAFEKNSEIACIYGRQLPHDDANHLAQHARIFNYKQQSYTVSIEDKKRLGIKTVFTSNSFCAYKIKIFKEINGFPINTILSEDMYFAAKAINSGYKVGYAANAIVKHSHNYSCFEEFRRYFDIGVFHSQEAWIRDDFGGAGGEGKSFILSEIKYLLKNAPYELLSAGTHNLCKILGYKIGMKYKRLPIFLIKKFSMHSRYWRG